MLFSELRLAEATKIITRSLEKAKEAFRTRNSEASRVAHRTPAAEKHKSAQGQYIKSLIYGGLDGIITTFAVVAGVAGASLSVGIVLILGFANLIADGLSMAIGDYISTRAENEYNRAERTREIWEIENYPEGEKKELTELYVGRGIDENDARTITDLISKYGSAWVDIMMVEELGIVENAASPLKNSIVTFLSFCAFGFLPLLAYVLSRLLPQLTAITFPIACVLTGLTLFTLGALKVQITDRNWFISGLEMFAVGGIAAAAAYAIGVLLSGLA